MKVIGIFAQKGGAGKSTIATHYAVLAAERQAVFLADADPQGSVKGWAANREAESPFVGVVTPSNIAAAIEAAEEAGQSLMIVDFPPHASAAVAGLVAHVDFVVIPCRSTPADLMTVQATVDIVTAHKKPFAFVLNGVRRQSTKRITSAREVLESYGEVCPFEIPNLDAFADSWIDGQAVTEYAPDSPAAHDIRKVGEWIEQRIQQEQQA